MYTVYPRSDTTTVIIVVFRVNIYFGASCWLVSWSCPAQYIQLFPRRAGRSQYLHIVVTPYLFIALYLLPGLLLAVLYLRQPYPHRAMEPVLVLHTGGSD